MKTDMNFKKNCWSMAIRERDVAYLPKLSTIDPT